MSCSYFQHLAQYTIIGHAGLPRIVLVSKLGVLISIEHENVLVFNIHRVIVPVFNSIKTTVNTLQALSVSINHCTVARAVTSPGVIVKHH